MCLDWTPIINFANSQFVSALMGALAGAFAGAYAAQRSASRSKRKDEIVAEIRQTNAAMSVSFTIFNAAIALKGQHVARLAAELHSGRISAIEFLAKRAAGEFPPDTPFEFRADLSLLPQVRVPGELLREHVFLKLSVTGRPLSLATVITQTAHVLDDSIEKRNSLIAELKEVSAQNRNEVAWRYFGLPTSDGTNSEYPDTLNAIVRYLDDLIFFSQLLCKDLRGHGLELAAEYKRQFDGVELRVSEIEFVDSRTAGLLPRDEEYQDWLTGFPKREEKDRS